MYAPLTYIQLVSLLLYKIHLPICYDYICINEYYLKRIARQQLENAYFNGKQNWFEVYAISNYFFPDI